MEYDFRINRYNPNKNTLQGLCGQLGISTNANKSIQQESQAKFNKENILLTIGILNWIIVIATECADDYEGTLLFGVIMFPWFFYFIWYTPYMLIVKIRRFFRNN
jgi:hypothetical protein